MRKTIGATRIPWAKSNPRMHQRQLGRNRPPFSFPVDMKHSDFHVGPEFLGPAGLRWRCTDVGTRTIVAIRLAHEDPNWYCGPPYVATEEVFDEHEMANCHFTEEDAIRAAIEDDSIQS